MRRRLRRFVYPLTMISAAPLVGLTLVMPDTYATVTRSVALVAGVASGVGLLWLALAYGRYYTHRRRFQRILVSEGLDARRPRLTAGMSAGRSTPTASARRVEAPSR